MKTSFANGHWPKLQRHWDIRAALNFIGGGTGSGLIAGAAIAAIAGQPFAPALLAGLGFVAFGLFMVLLEIGRPWRAFNIFFHPRTSWLTREGVMALPLFGSGGLALLLHWSGSLAGTAAALSTLAGLLACGFLYCQARILRAAKGIPAWREAALVPFMLTSGLTEGAGVLTALAAFDLAPSWAALAALGFGALRLAAWQNYVKGLRTHNAPAASIAAIERIGLIFVTMGHGLAAVLLVAAIFRPELTGAAVAGGLLLAAAGWQAKLTVVIEAAATRGFAVPRTPVRGGTPLKLR